MLDAAAAGYPDWAAPRYLQAEALALTAEYARSTGEDPTESLGRARQAIAAGRSINPTDATGISRSSLAFLVDARWRSQREIDPSSAVSEGIRSIDDAIEANPNLASAHVRRAELLLIRAEWKLEQQRTAADDLGEAETAISKAAEINPNDALIPTLQAEARRLGQRMERPGPPS
jgi:HAMP domain-containing protein